MSTLVADPSSSIRQPLFGRSAESATDLTTGGFNVHAFANKIENQLDGKVPGYGYCIIVDGQVKVQKGVGKARYGVDAPMRNYSDNEIQDIGSTTKYFAALLAMKLLDRTGLPINTAIEKKAYLYFPKFFTPSSDFQKVTFRDLMAHTSGVIKYGDTFADIQKTVESGINETTDAAPLDSPKPFGQYDYQNLNYVLLRYCTVYLAATQIPALDAELKSAEVPEVIEEDFGGAGEGPYQKPNVHTYQAINKTALNLKICTWYRKLLREEIFQPALLTQWNLVDFKAWGIHDAERIKYYTSVNSAVAGYDSGDHLTGAAGAGGLKLSARHMAQVVAAARAGIVVKPALLAKMKSGDGNFNQMGFDDAYNRSHGLYYHKNGAGAGNAVLFDFDGPGVNVQLAITTNTTGTDVTTTSIWANLFDQSWS